VGFIIVVQLVQMEWSKHSEDVGNPVANAEILFLAIFFTFLRKCIFGDIL